MAGSMTRPAATRAKVARASLAADLAHLVHFSPVIDGARWRVNGGAGRWLGRIGRDIARIDIKNARALAVVLLFDDGSTGSFHPNDLSPAP